MKIDDWVYCCYNKDVEFFLTQFKFYKVLDIRVFNGVDTIEVKDDKGNRHLMRTDRFSEDTLDSNYVRMYD